MIRELAEATPTDFEEIGLGQLWDLLAEVSERDVEIHTHILRRGQRSFVVLLELVNSNSRDQRHPKPVLTVDDRARMAPEGPSRRVSAWTPPSGRG